MFSTHYVYFIPPTLPGQCTSLQLYITGTNFIYCLASFFFRIKRKTLLLSFLFYYKNFFFSFFLASDIIVYFDTSVFRCTYYLYRGFWLFRIPSSSSDYYYLLC